MRDVDGAKWAIGMIESGKLGFADPRDATRLIVDHDKMWAHLMWALAKGRTR